MSDRVENNHSLLMPIGSTSNLLDTRTLSNEFNAWRLMLDAWTGQMLCILFLPPFAICMILLWWPYNTHIFHLSFLLRSYVEFSFVNLLIILLLLLFRCVLRLYVSIGISVCTVYASTGTDRLQLYKVSRWLCFSLRIQYKNKQEAPWENLTTLI